MTRAEIRAMCLRLVDEDPTSANRWISDTDANNAIAMALRVFCFLTLCSEAKDTVAVAANASHTLILSTVPNLIVPLRISQAGATLSRSSLASFRAISDVWRNSPGVPERYAMVGANAIALHPVPSSSDVSSVVMTYARFAPALGDDTAVPDIPLEDHDAIATGAAAIIDGLKVGGQTNGQAKARLEEFIATVRRRAAWVRSRSIANRFDAKPAEISKAQIKKLLESVK